MIPSTRKRLRAICYFNEQIFTEINEESDPEYIRLLDECAIKLLTNTMIIVGFLLFFSMIYFIFPVYDTIVDGKIHLIIPILFPFTDLETNYGIAVNILSQSMLNTIAIIGIYGMVIGTCVTKHAIISYAATIGYQMDRLTIYINKNYSQSPQRIDDHFRNILYQLEQYNRYRETF